MARRGTLGILASFCLGLAVCLIPFPAAAQRDEFAVSKIEVGLDGYFKVGEPTLVRVHLQWTRSPTLSLVIECADVDGIPASFRSPPVAVEEGKPTVIEATFAIGRLNSGLSLSLVDEVGTEWWSEKLSPSADTGSPIHPALRLETPIWLSLARLPAALTTPDDETPATTGEPRVITYNETGRLPTNWLGYRPASVVILPTRASAGVGSSLLESLSEPQSAALRTWVEQGGHLLLSLSDPAAYLASPLAQWVPLSVEGDVALQQFSNLESFASKGTALRSAGRVRIPRVKGLPNSQVPVRDLGGAPIIATVPFGFGRVSAILLDIERPPLSDWQGLPSTLLKLGGVTARNVKTQSAGVGRKLIQKGVGDLATQWNQTQEDFPEIQRPSYWWVMLLILLTVAVIGPLDYFLVQRIVKRPEITWITFPLLVAGFVLLGARWGNRVNGREIRVNQTDLIDVDVAGGILRGRSWVALYNPEHERLAVEVQATPPLSATPAAEGEQGKGGALLSRISWAGSPENSMGGIYRDPGLSSGGRRYSFAADARRIENLPVLQWSTRGLRADWQGRLGEPVLTSRLQSTGYNQVTGTLTHNLPGTLEDCLLVVGGWAYFPNNDTRSLAPGVPWQPTGAMGKQRELRALLTRERRTRHQREGKLESEIVTSVEPYDPLGRDLGDILKMISFHQAVGGNDYTGLNHAGLGDLELTPLSQLGRGVLIGRLQTPGAVVTINGAEQPATHQTTFVRLVVPIEQIDRSSPNTLPKLNEPRTTTLPQQADPGDRNSKFD